MYYLPPYIRMIRGTAFPLLPFETQLFYRDDLNAWFIFDGTVWINLQAAGIIVHGNAWHAPNFATEAALLAHLADIAAGVHGSSVAALINTLIHRDAAARSQIADPAVAADIDNLGARDAAIAVHAALPTVHQDAPALIAVHAALPTVHQDAPALIAVHAALATGIHGVGGSTVDSVAARVAAIAAHAALTAAGIHGSTVAATFNRLVHRDAAGRSQIVNPAVAADIDNLGARNTAIAVHAALPTVHQDAPALIAVHAALPTVHQDAPALIAVHAVLSTGVHGVGTGTIASVSTANKTIYVDKAAIGAGNGTSWADAFTTIQAAIDANEDIIIHAYTIRVRKGATPYDEELYFNSDPASHPATKILGSLSVEGEYYWNGDCEANVGGAGEITDAGAFADVLVGDRVLVMDFNGANSRIINYELCTVDNIANIPNRIGTDGVLVPTLGWKYVIVRTVLTGASNDNLFSFTSIENVTVKGFLATVAPSSLWIYALYSKNIALKVLILENMGKGGLIRSCQAIIEDVYLQVALAGTYGLYMSGLSYVMWTRGVIDGVSYCIYAQGNCYWQPDGVYFKSATRGNYLEMEVGAYLIRSFIENTVGTGIMARYNSAIRTFALTNNAPIPVNPVGTVEGAYIN